jgi:hypothetical protein
LTAIALRFPASIPAIAETLASTRFEAEPQSGQSCAWSYSAIGRNNENVPQRGQP